ncbi:trehalose 6-phosphate phosphatase [Sphingomonas jejuensis]|uniref:Trehalose 6-phosphate phosphatase n=1 Tax=Sphingomonas jejuensis TaxID=904715 RepID=A0ABX0XKP5_9SPHN|nr:trehalose-phosphatase [Sphingomonas jejuensis]NJC33743.1 trehalose 6-phosphate phosphatase [Sphingomonas jejuensis]
MADLPTPPRLPSDASLFLDFDGTLVELAERPDGVVVDRALTDLLDALGTRFGNRVALISGRSVAQLDEMLGAAAAPLAIAGSHGLEERWQGSLSTPDRPQALTDAEHAFDDFAANRSGVLVERKSLGVALHFRLAPDAENAAVALASRLGEAPGLHYQPGKMMAELRLDGADKGTAITALLQRPELAGTVPVFLGDDVTDEPGFAAAGAGGGFGVLVGAERPTAARYRLPDVAAVRHWLAQSLEETA